MARSPADRRGRVAASPRARSQMRAAGVDPKSIRGNGPGGRIVAADVAAAGPLNALAPQENFGAGLSPMRRSVARATTASALIPQFQLHAELDARAMIETRERLLPILQKETSVRLSFTDFMLCAMAAALVDNPAANAIWLDGTIVRLSEANVGLIVSLDDGLWLPTIRAVDRLRLGELAVQRESAASAARGGRMLSTARAATSLSNLGTTRVDDFAAIVFPPQSTILAAGRISERPWAAGGRLVVASTLRLTLTVDHRVLDGAPAAQFLGRIVHYLEDPARMLKDRAASQT